MVVSRCGFRVMLERTIFLESLFADAVRRMLIVLLIITSTDVCAGADWPYTRWILRTRLDVVDTNVPPVLKLRLS